MRILLFAGVLVFTGVLALALLVPLSVAHQASAAQAISFRFAGNGAHANWTTCPEGPSAGQTCTETFIFAADQVTHENAAKSESTALFLDQFTYRLDHTGKAVFISQRFGFDESAEFSVNDPKKLDSASVVGDVALNFCTVDGEDNLTCQEDGVIQVEASWTGQGDITQTGSKPDSKGTFREATVNGQMNGADLGSPFSAGLFYMRDGSMTICHIC